MKSFNICLDEKGQVDLRRLILSLITVFSCITFSFFLIHFVPGDPVDLILGEQAHTIEQQELRSQMGLGLPLYQQYFRFLKNVLTLQFGVSIYNQEPVLSLIKKAAPPTLTLTFFALILSCLWGIPSAVLSAFYKNTFLDRSLSFISLCGFSLPVFVSAPLLIWIFAIYFPIFSISEDAYFLPALSLALPLGSALCQMGRSSLLEILNQDYIRTAQSKGLRLFDIYFKHALKPALVPLITILSLQLASLLTGTIIIETIFDLPGIGLLLFRSITRRDYPVIQMCVLVIALVYLTVNWLADEAYSLANPQIKIKG